jgi:hypothetical protein
MKTESRKHFTCRFRAASYTSIVVFRRFTIGLITCALMACSGAAYANDGGEPGSGDSSQVGAAELRLAKKRGAPSLPFITAYHGPLSAILGAKRLGRIAPPTLHELGDSATAVAPGNRSGGWLRRVRRGR